MRFEILASIPCSGYVGAGWVRRLRRRAGARHQRRPLFRRPPRPGRDEGRDLAPRLQCPATGARRGGRPPGHRIGALSPVLPLPDPRTRAARLRLPRRRLRGAAALRQPDGRAGPVLRHRPGETAARGGWRRRPLRPRTSWIPAFSTLYAVRGNRWLTIAYSDASLPRPRREAAAAALAREAFKLTAR